MAHPHAKAGGDDADQTTATLDLAGNARAAILPCHRHSHFHDAVAFARHRDSCSF
jgi:hypothetical protein